MICHKVVIEIEDVNTWPNEVTNIFNKNFGVLQKSQAFEIKDPGSLNPFKTKFNSIIDEANSVIADIEVIGYHCTRLLNYEREEIRQTGFQLPSRTLLRKRLIAACEKGYIHQSLLHNIMEENEYTKKPIRENILYFVCGASELKISSGISKFFQCWGGEAIYNSNELSRHREVLFRIGEPTIIQVKVKPGNEINIGERLAFAYLIAKDVPTENAPSFDHRSKQPLPSSIIMKIINFDDAEFLKLTDYKSWDEEKQPNLNDALIV